MVLSALLLAACAGDPGEAPAGSDEQAKPLPQADADNGGLTLPPGFRALVVADDLGVARHLAVRSNGDIYVALRRPAEGGGIAALRDSNGDGRADEIRRFGEMGGTGLVIREGYLYFATETSVLRYRLPGEEELVPQGEPEVILDGLPEQNEHAAKPITFDEQGRFYITVGAPSNACQEQNRTPGSMGMDPCPLLERQGGIWRFDGNKIGQSQQADGFRYATGIRHAVAVEWNSQTASLFALQHGRDQLHQFWPDLFTEEQSAELPAEEFLQVSEGSNFGWPFCYWDQIQNKRVLAPEYGGNGSEVGRCDQFGRPILAFPGHWAPNDLIFYGGSQFPSRYQGGAFIAFHGSWNRAPLPQGGYLVAFVPFQGGSPSGEWERFADGFAGVETIETPTQARYRPTGLAEGPDGSLFITDTEKGRVWRVIYSGQ